MLIKEKDINKILLMLMNKRRNTIFYLQLS